MDPLTIKALLVIVTIMLTAFLGMQVKTDLVFDNTGSPTGTTICSGWFDCSGDFPSDSTFTSPFYGDIPDEEEKAVKEKATALSS
jgi:hypothetical protein